MTHPDATLHYYARKMILHVASDASYIYEEKSHSQAGGHFPLFDRINKSPTLPTNNGAIQTLSHMIKTVMSSAAESEIGATFLNAKDALPICTTLKELVHPQPPTTMQVDNNTAVYFANDTINQKKSKAIDMRFYWTRNRTRQGHLKIYWDP